MDIRILNYFVTIAQEKNITRAAEKLLMTQPALSRQLKLLEEELGVVLFRRSSRQLQLTEDGQYLYNRALEILSLVNKTEETLTRKGDIGGDLYIGAAESASMFLIAKACDRMLSMYPQVRFHFLSDNADAVYENLDKGILDFGIVFATQVSHKYQSLELPSQDHWCIIAPKHHPLAIQKEISLTDIITYPLIISAQTNHLDHSLFKGLGDYRIVATYNLLYNAGLLVKVGLGIALALDGIVQDPDLVTIPLKEQGNDKLYLIWRHKANQTATELAFMNEVNQQIENANTETNNRS
ncbi:LysR family transcriptional regulator [Streptococcus sp. zg-JUN1979]|uniref:LysR family transcriptional regulator n=1 Tax=Streptococcus sp. zg-JUN1979 TaxID=3391450 RepID=UPI0039A6CD26